MTFKVVKLSFLLFALILFSCKKDVDNKEPVIIISFPYENQQFSAIDTIQIVAEVEDETALKKINITLTDNNKTPVLNTYSILPENKKVNISIPYILDNINLDAGNYYLCINASDGFNEHYKYRNIYINEIARKLTYTYIFTYATNNTINVFRLNTLGIMQQLSDISGDFCTSAVSSKHQLIFTSGKLFGNVNAYAVSNNSLEWSVPVVSNPPFPYFTDIGCFDNILYLNFYDGFIRGYNNYGNTTVTANTSSGTYPEKIFVNGEYIFADNALISDSSRNFSVYFLVSGALKQFINTNYKVVDMYEKDNDNVFIFANSQGQGIIKLYSISANGTWQPHSIPAGKINDVAQIDQNKYIIAHENGLYKYDYSSNSLTSYIAGINATSVKLEDVSSDIYISEGKKLTVYDYDSHSLVNTINLTDSILDFQLLYNK